MVVFSAIPSINPWYFMLSSIPSMLTGGFAAFLVTILSYISDISTDETRGMRMALMEGMLGAGMLFGSLCSSYLYYATNYPSMYGISAGIMGLNIIYIYFCLSESLENIEHEVSYL
uniref:Proton-coupled folate transporter-like n=1 Tax=Diabrotica virgifera virgifera TaxID=50390 RepID=A0A6P7GGZ4_DIAVI